MCNFCLFMFIIRFRMLAFTPKDLNLDDLKKKLRTGSIKLLGSSKGPRVESSTGL